MGMPVKQQGTDESVDLPDFIAESVRSLSDSATAADAKAGYLFAQGLRLRELQIQKYQLGWLLKRDDSELLESLSGVHKAEVDRLWKLSRQCREVETELEKIEVDVAGLLQQLRARNPAVIKSVVAVDMARYSDVIKDIEDRFPGKGPHKIAELNEQIQRWMGDAASEVGIAPERLPKQPTGDGALVVVDSPDEASRLVEQLHLISQSYNRDKHRHLERRHFRAGIATGPLFLDQSRNTIEMAGLIISNAVRLEGAAKTGCVLIDIPTYELLSMQERKHYGAEQVVRGKRAERLRSRERRIVPPAPWDKVRTAKELA
jgi:hypothetical protein